MPIKSLGPLIKEYREKNRLSQSELAELLEYPGPQMISLIERQQTKVPMETLGKLIVFLEIPEAKVVRMISESYKEKIISEIGEGKKRVGTGEGKREASL